ncbi:restriction endonuclease [Chloroflexia bacterium SDU3-3]|nr:restriction endonuclease [Chloroflexia bacterium SDU3-3]
MPTRSIHAEWLRLVEQSGPFLLPPALDRAFPQGLNATPPDLTAALRLAYIEWKDATQGLAPDMAMHRAWVEWVLRDVLAMNASLIRRAGGAGAWPEVGVPEHGELLQPDLVVGMAGGAARLLIQVLPPWQDLGKALPKARWQASPASRMEHLLRGAGVRLGLLTNGEHWMLVSGPADAASTTGFGSWYARLWLDEPLTFQAFHSLLGAHRLFGVADEDTLEALLRESAGQRQEVADQLGYQVRRAVELLVQAIDLADQNERRALLADIENEQIYHAALAVMMRLVFLLFAEEQRLLLLGDELYDRSYAASTLLDALREEADRSGEEVLEYRYDAWARLLALFRAVFGGMRHDRLTIAAYGGSLFDPDAYPFLEGRAKGTTWRDTPAIPLPISNRTVLHLLEALQMLRTSRDGGVAEAQRLSFRSLDIEQIGHVYEGLLDHTAVRATDVVLGLIGTSEREPEIPLAQLEQLMPKLGAAPTGQGSPLGSNAMHAFGAGLRLPFTEDLISFLGEETGRSASALRKAMSSPKDDAQLASLRSICGDQNLYDQVYPFAKLVRSDDYGRPVVIKKNQIYVTSGTQRRESGTHYTPRSLTIPMVEHTLEPLVYDGPATGAPQEKWKLRPASELLRLTICDPAMGSGAFLVQSCRYLAERLVDAWAEAENKVQEDSALPVEKRDQPDLTDVSLDTIAPNSVPRSHARRPLITPEGFPTDNPDEAIPADTQERLILAQQLVADRCLYGVDKNPLAVEMAKLSLWLVTLSSGRPFGFLDHALRCGDSLLGIRSIGQLMAWDLGYTDGADGSRLSFLAEPLRWAMERARSLRQQIRRTPSLDVRDTEQKARWLREAEEAMDLLRLAADLLVAAQLHSDKKQRDLLRIHFEAKMMGVAQAWQGATIGGAGALHLDAAREVLDELREEAEDLLDGRRPFHWPLEFPEVFADGGDEADIDQMLAAVRTGGAVPEQAAPGFAALVGNPPFMGGQKITGALGTPYRDFLVSYLAHGQRGSADICAYFFLRAGSLLRKGGQFGMLATNTIAQGDTREVGLDKLVADGMIIPRAVPSRRWPGKAAVEVAHIWVRHGDWRGVYVLNDQPTSSITPFLTTASAASGTPFRLKANENKSFIGSYVLGMGFVLEPDEAQALIERDPRNKDVLFPYLNGEDLNSRPDQSPSRWVINFHDWPLERAETYPDVMRIVREKVKPERDKLGEGNPTAKDRSRRWWQFARQTMNLYATIAGMERVIVTALVSKYVNFIFEPSNIVFMHKLAIFPLSNIYLSIVQSTIHTEWAWQRSSTLGGSTINYSPTDCFETFPFPFCEGVSAKIAALATIGERYHSHRQRIMRERQEGLTKTYNRFHDQREASADIAELRRLHVEMDQAVAAAYGWGDLDLGHGFHETKQGLRYTIDEAARRSVLDRLLLLNHERHAEEVAAGLHEKRPAKKPTGAAKRPRKAVDSGQLGLDLGEDAIAPSIPTALQPQHAPEKIIDTATLSPKPINVPANMVSVVPKPSQLSPLNKQTILFARMLELHQEHDRDYTLGRIKLEKIAHLVEAHFATDLGRMPRRMAAGPADTVQLRKVLTYGKKIEAFREHMWYSKDQRRFRLIPQPNLHPIAGRMRSAFGEQTDAIEKFIISMVGLDSDQAEIIATLYAAWNDLLADRQQVSEELLFQTFYDWHPNKEKYSWGQLRIMHQRIIDERIIPTGRAKRTVPR